MKTCSKRDCRVFFKVHMLDANLDQFMESMGAYSEELDERFLQDRLYYILNVAIQDSIISV